MYFFSRVLNHLIKVTLSHTIASQFRIQLPTSTWLCLQVSATPSSSSSKQASFVRLTWVSQHSKLHCYWILPWHDLLYSLGREEFIQTSFRLIIITYLTWINALTLFPGGQGQISQLSSAMKMERISTKLLRLLCIFSYWLLWFLLVHWAVYLK